MVAVLDCRRVCLPIELLRCRRHTELPDCSETGLLDSSQLSEQISTFSRFHETVPLGKALQNRADADQVLTRLNNRSFNLQTAFTAVFVLSAMFILNLRLTCVLLPLMPFSSLKRQYEIRLRRAADKPRRNPARRTTLQEHLSSVVQIHSCAGETQTRAFITRAQAKMQDSIAGTYRKSCSNLVSAEGRHWNDCNSQLWRYEVFLRALTVGGFVAFYSYLARYLGH